MSDTAVETPRRKVDYSKDVVTEQDKLHLVMQIADEIGRRYRIDPCELWGAGWLGMKLAEVTWRPVAPVLAFMRVKIRGAILDSLGRKKIDEITYTGAIFDGLGSDESD